MYRYSKSGESGESVEFLSPNYTYPRASLTFWLLVGVTTLSVVNGGCPICGGGATGIKATLHSSVESLGTVHMVLHWHGFLLALP